MLLDGFLAGDAGLRGRAGFEAGCRDRYAALDARAGLAVGEPLEGAVDFAQRRQFMVQQRQVGGGRVTRFFQVIGQRQLVRVVRVVQACPNMAEHFFAALAQQGVEFGQDCGR